VDMPAPISRRCWFFRIKIRYRLAVHRSTHGIGTSKAHLSTLACLDETVRRRSARPPKDYETFTGFDFIAMI